MLKKRIIIISIVVILMVISYISFSLALFQKPVAQQGSNVISTTDCLSISISNVNSALTLNSEYPKPDKQGLNGAPYTFSITNDCSHLMEVDIGFEKTSTSTLGSDQFKLALNLSGKGKINHDLFDNYPLGVATNAGDARVLLKTELENQETKTYDFRMWIDYDQEAADIANKGLTGNIIVTGTIKKKQEIACVDEAHPNPTQGDEFNQNGFKYVYKKKLTSASAINLSNYTETWANMTEDGWGVHFPATTIIDPTTTLSPLCSTINGKPVINMDGLFYEESRSLLPLPDDLNTSNITSMANLFNSVRATALNLRGLNTSKVTDMSYMFGSCTTAALDLSGFDTSNVTNMASMFAGSAATTLDLSGFDTSSVTNMERMFGLCEATSIDLSNFDTSNVTSMYQMFYGSSVTSLNLSSFDTSNVTNMQQMFSNSAATNLDLTSFDTSNVTNMARMFFRSSAAVLDLSSFDMSNVTNTTAMFQNAAATVGYARTQADADKLNASSNKPAALTFVVKNSNY